MVKLKRLKVYLLLFSVLCVSLWWDCFAPGAYSQDPAGALAEKLRQLSAELRRKREKRTSERRLLESRKSLLLEEIQTLKEREKELAARRDSLEQEALKLDERLENAASEADSMRRMRIEAEKLVGRTAAALENYIDSGLPLDARARKDTVRDLLTGGDEPAQQLKLLWQLYVQEYRRAGEIELTSPPALTGSGTEHVREEPPAFRQELAGPPAASPTPAVELEDGNRFQGRVLRIGAVGAAFLSDSANTAAVLVRTSKGSVWRRVGTHGELAQLRRAFEIAAGRRAPHIVNIPLQLAPGSAQPAKPGKEGGGK